MAILKFLLVVILLLLLVPLVRVAMMMWTFRRSFKQARDAAERIYGDGPYRPRSRAAASEPQGTYADYEEVNGEATAAADAGGDNTTFTQSQVIDAEFEEL